MKTEKMQTEVPWKKSERFARKGEFNLKGTAGEIFPLLCPVLEYEWLPDWKCIMFYSESGVAEKDAIFHTRELHGKKVVWTCITYEPDTCIEYLMVSGTDAVIRLSISLEEIEETSTHIIWRMLFTATSPLAARLLRKSFSETRFREMMKNREKELNYYLAEGNIIIST